MYCSDFVEISSYHSACEHANAKGMSNTTPVVVAFTSTNEVGNIIRHFQSCRVL